MHILCDVIVLLRTSFIKINTKIVNKEKVEIFKFSTVTIFVVNLNGQGR